MTRITSVSLLKCTNCHQIHIKPLYGSISIYVPPDMHSQADEIRTCSGCGLNQRYDKFKYIGSTGLSIEIDEFPRDPTLWHRIRRLLNKSYLCKKTSVYDLYPRI